MAKLKKITGQYQQQNLIKLKLTYTNLPCKT